MLAELKAAHAELLSRMNDLEALTRLEAADRAKIATLRWRLSQTSGRRMRLMEERIYPELRKAAAAGDVVRLMALRDANIALMAASAKHIGAWSIEQILADWQGYRKASAKMLSSMRKRIQDEQEVVYRLLETKIR